MNAAVVRNLKKGRKRSFHTLEDDHGPLRVHNDQTEGWWLDKQLIGFVADFGLTVYGDRRRDCAKCTPSGNGGVWTTETIMPRFFPNYPYMSNADKKKKDKSALQRDVLARINMQSSTDENLLPPKKGPGKPRGITAKTRSRGRTSPAHHLRDNFININKPRCIPTNGNIK